MHKQTHVFLIPFSIIMATIDDTHILTNVVIIHSTCTNLVLQAICFRVIVTIVAQTKIAPYCDRHLENDFIFLTIEIFKCLHQQANDFFHRRANITWSLKGFKSPPLSIIHYFIGKKCQWLLAIKEATFRCDVLPSFSPIFWHALFCVTGDGFRS